MSIITALHHAITETLRENIAHLHTIAHYPKLRTAIDVPALFIDLASLEPGSDPATEELALITRFEARVVVSSQEDAALQVRELATEVARIIHRNSFGLAVSPATLLSLGADGFNPALDAYEVWMIEWEHELHIGESVWDGEGIVPETIYLGYAPRIGRAYEEEYYLAAKRETS